MVSSRALDAASAFLFVGWHLRAFARSAGPNGHGAFNETVRSSKCFLINGSGS
jgi:hypothetical protein